MRGIEAAPAPAPRAEGPLRQAWLQPPGFLGWFKAVNHKNIGMRFILTGLGFMVAGGVLALLMRTQLAAPESGFLDAETYNELFTVHGTTMMFLFAVPILEGLGMYLLPLMLGTRDLPFPRLNAFGYWCYLFGGLFVFSSFLGGDAPSEGWFAYVPLSGPEYAPGDGMDFWLLGVTLVEVSAIIGAAELIVVFFARRAPGMSINRVPLFAWAILVMSAMIVFAFPALIVASVLLEVERIFGTRFYDPGAGGDALLWQHLFWFFGHPEVYIMLIPATGIVSMVVPVFSRRRIAGYTFVVAALVAIGLISFGLWVHHMFTTGLSLLGLSIFAAASFLIVIPSGVQVFAWLATMWRGRPSFRTPMLFVLGFLFVFILGGITGVMVAAVPFDWQVHDSFFIVAHFHYVLIGGVLFPIFGGLYHWFPKWTGRLMSEGWGQASFWTMFVGFNVAFFPQHIIGLEGMPRRVFTYSEAEGWGTLNLISTIGAYVFALGVAITLVNMALSLRRGRESGPNPWGAGSLEWATESPPPPYNFRTLPTVGDLEPVWHPARPEGGTERLVEELASPSEPLREVIETSPVEGAPQRVAVLPGPSLQPLGIAVALLVGLIGALTYTPWLAVVGAGLALALAAVWAGGAIGEAREQTLARTVPVWRSGAGFWGAVVAGLSLIMALGSLVFAYLLLATDAESWPPPGVSDPSLVAPLLAAVAALGAAVAVRAAARALGRAGRGACAAWLAAALALVGAFAALAGVWLGGTGASPTEHAYGSIVFAVVGFELLLAGTLAAVLAVVAWQLAEGAVVAEQPVSLRVTEALAWLVAISAPIAFALVYLTPRIA